jgi:gamma-glutamylcyclotransferase (GGCT)/AIG2-like uncharacterized protein YtfP
MDDLRHPAVFVYGTLQPEQRYWKKYCAGKVLRACPARVRGQLFDLKKVNYPALLLDASSAARWRAKEETNPWVSGWLLVLRDAATLRDLDRLEDYDARRPSSKNEYTRVRVRCYAGARRLNDAWTYVMAPEKIAALGGVALPSGVWNENS